MDNILPKTMSKSMLVAAFVIVNIFTPFAADAMSVAQMRVQVQSLMQVVAQLQQRLKQTSGNVISHVRTNQNYLTQQCANFSNNMHAGKRDWNTGGEVSKLQRFLKGTGDYTYPEITGYYGHATQSAVQRWQSNHHVVSYGTPSSTGYGVVGPMTRERMRCKHGGVQVETSLPTSQVLVCGFKERPSCTMLCVGYGHCCPGVYKTYATRGDLQRDPGLVYFEHMGSCTKSELSLNVNHNNNDSDGNIDNSVNNSPIINSFTTSSNSARSGHKIHLSWSTNSAVTNCDVIEVGGKSYFNNGLVKSIEVIPSRVTANNDVHFQLQCRARVGGSVHKDIYIRVNGTSVAVDRAPIIRSFSGPTSLSVDEVGKWVVKASDESNGNLTYKIKWDNDDSERETRSYTYSDRQITTFSHSYPQRGEYTVAVSVEDDDNKIATDEIKVIVKGSVIHEDFSFIGPVQLDKGENGTWKLVGGNSRCVMVDWGDGDSEQTVCDNFDLITHTYNDIGEHTIKTTIGSVVKEVKVNIKEEVIQTTKGSFMSEDIGTNACSLSAAGASANNKAKIIFRENHNICVGGTCIGTDTKKAVSQYLGITYESVKTATCNAQNKHNNGPISSYDSDDLRDGCKGDFIYYAKCDYEIIGNAAGQGANGKVCSDYSSNACPANKCTVIKHGGLNWMGLKCVNK